MFPNLSFFSSSVMFSSGVISERDYITKIALLGRTSKETKVKEIATVGGRITTAKADESVESCMEKMMSKGIRHLPIVDAKGAVTGTFVCVLLGRIVLSVCESAVSI